MLEENTFFPSQEGEGVRQSIEGGRGKVFLPDHNATCNNMYSKGLIAAYLIFQQFPLSSF